MIEKNKKKNSRKYVINILLHINTEHLTRTLWWSSYKNINSNKNKIKQWNKEDIKKTDKKVPLARFELGISCIEGQYPNHYCSSTVFADIVD